MIAQARGFALSANDISTAKSPSCQRFPLWLSRMIRDNAPENIQQALNFCLEILSPSHPMLGLKIIVLNAKIVTNAAAITRFVSSLRLLPDRNHIITGAKRKLMPEWTVFRNPTESTMSQYVGVDRKSVV